MLDEDYPPKTPCSFIYANMSPEQTRFLNERLHNSIVCGGPSSGKTVLAIMKALHLSREGYKCLFISATYLSQKYIRDFISKLQLQTDLSSIWNVTSLGSVHYNVIILDDAEQYSLGQIKQLSAISDYLLLFGDFERNMLYDGGCTIDKLREDIDFTTFNLYEPYALPLKYGRLLRRFSNKVISRTKTDRLPVISQIGSFAQQCLAAAEIIRRLSLENVGILCFTRKLVKSASSYFNNYDLPIEVYLPKNGDEKVVDSIDFNSFKPKLMTIASSRGIHFDSVFVLGFDSTIIFTREDEILETVISRSRMDLFIFYEKQLPRVFESIPEQFYRKNFALSDDLF